MSVRSFSCRKGALCLSLFFCLSVCGQVSALSLYFAVGCERCPWYCFKIKVLRCVICSAWLLILPGSVCVFVCLFTSAFPFLSVRYVSLDRRFSKFLLLISVLFLLLCVSFYISDDWCISYVYIFEVSGYSYKSSPYILAEITPYLTVHSKSGFSQMDSTADFWKS